MQSIIRKLLNIGIPSHIARWLAAFLCNRTQRVRVEYRRVQKLGPKLFLIHVNDLQTPLPVYKYIDDCNLIEIFAKGDISSLQESLDIVSDWSERNDVCINPQKTKRSGSMLL